LVYINIEKALNRPAVDVTIVADMFNNFAINIIYGSAVVRYGTAELCDDVSAKPVSWKSSIHRSAGWFKDVYRHAT